MKKSKNKVLGVICLVLIVAFLVSCGQSPEDHSGESDNQESTSIQEGKDATSNDEALENEDEDFTIIDSVPELNAKEKRAKDILSSMTLEEKVGQMFFVRCPDAEAVQKITQYNLGGYILFSRDFKDSTKKQVLENTQSYQNASKIPMIIGVDEEGGTVNRISRYPLFRSTPFSSPQSLYREGGFELITSDTEEKAKLLKSLGINLNMAPVCDVSENKNDYIYKRTFGKDAKETSLYVKTVTEAMVREKLGCVLKHFPGYGNNKDTHTGIAYDMRDYETFTSSDFLPFKAGIEAGAGAILVSHNVVDCMDKEKPASLSKNVHRILREELQFEGVIMTDDLVMEGIRKFTGESEAAVMAVLSGNDMLCATNFESQIPAVISAVNNGEIPIEQIDDSVLRILIWKIDLGIIE
ncbi:glycoside hydrolase family 3 protein [Wukongibacter sp. M2B1]|uniref:glycoside hydrolase family 3 protein n=1 Tax=Wukongibacter sp. M2B1 TaxID=3088895 RepID=UPI003D798F82